MYERWKRRQESIVVLMVTKPTLPDGMCLSTGYNQPKGLGVSIYL